MQTRQILVLFVLGYLCGLGTLYPWIRAGSSKEETATPMKVAVALQRLDQFDKNLKQSMAQNFLTAHVKFEEPNRPEVDRLKAALNSATRLGDSKAYNTIAGFLLELIQEEMDLDGGAPERKQPKIDALMRRAEASGYL